MSKHREHIDENTRLRLDLDEAEDRMDLAADERDRLASRVNDLEDELQESKGLHEMAAESVVKLRHALVLADAHIADLGAQLDETLQEAASARLALGDDS